ncbi:MAG: hypothetical protein JST59_04475 [Actinobacteria bacterium]|nr:hypothetical protein [Actinomycetota bacterium]
MSRAIVRPALVALLALGLLVVGAPAAWANTRYAAPSGAGPQPCLQAAPCTLTVALTGTGKDGVHAGDSVVVEPGTYHPAAGIAFEGVSSVGGEPGAPVPVIESSGSFGLEPGGDILVHDLRIIQPANQGTGLDLLNGAGAERVYVTNDEAAADAGACGLFGTVTLRDSLCVNTAEGGQGTGVTAATGSSSTSTATLDNVTAVGLFGISVRSEGGSSMTIDATNVIASGGTDDLRLRTDSSPGVSSTIKLGHSDFSTHLVEGSGNVFTSSKSRQNVSTEPLFADVAGGDFHEASGSPTIATGDLSVLVPGELDLDGTPRASALTCGAAATVDIGAYQSPAGECAPPPPALPGTDVPSPAPTTTTTTAPSSPLPPAPKSGPRVRVSCPKSAKPTGCKFAVQVVSGKPRRINGKLHAPEPESAVVRVSLAPGHSALLDLRPLPKFAVRLTAATSVLVREVETVAGKAHTDYRRVKVVGPSGP